MVVRRLNLPPAITHRHLVDSQLRMGRRIGENLRVSGVEIGVGQIRCRINPHFRSRRNGAAPLRVERFLTARWIQSARRGLDGLDELDIVD